MICDVPNGYVCHAFTRYQPICRINSGEMADAAAEWPWDVPLGESNFANPAEFVGVVHDVDEAVVAVDSSNGAQLSALVGSGWPLAVLV